MVVALRKCLVGSFSHSSICSRRSLPSAAKQSSSSTSRCVALRRVASRHAGERALRMPSVLLSFTAGAGSIDVRHGVRDPTGPDRRCVMENRNLHRSRHVGERRTPLPRPASPDGDALDARIRDAPIIRRRHSDRPVESRRVEENHLVLEDARIHDQMQLRVERERQDRTDDRFR